MEYRWKEDREHIRDMNLSWGLIDVIRAAGREAAHETLSEEPFRLTIRHHPDEHCYSYTYNQIMSNMCMPICQEARGVFITDEGEPRIVAAGFDKFFNIGESRDEAAPIIAAAWPNVSVQEKRDGSIIKISAIDKTSPVAPGNVLISTNNTPNAYKTPVGDSEDLTFGALVEELLPTTFSWDPDWSYIFELTGPRNRIVVPYTDDELVYLGRRNVYTSDTQIPRLNHTPLIEVFDKKPYLPVNHIANYQTLDELVTAVREWSWKEEGVVVSTVDDNDVVRMLKVKSEEYVTTHKLRGEVNPTKKRMLEMILNQEVDDFLSYFPEYNELHLTVQQDVNALLREMNSAGQHAKTCHISNTDRKTMALTGQQYVRKGFWTTLSQAYMFAVYGALERGADVPTPYEFLISSQSKTGKKGLAKTLGY